MKIYNVFYLNFFQKTFTDFLISQIKEPTQLIIMSKKLKKFLILGVIELKYNIRLNGLAGIKTGISIIFLDLIIFQKLLRIFMAVISINSKLK